MSEIKLMKMLEGMETRVYTCSAGYKTVGIGFNMDDPGARKVWSKLEIPLDFDRVYNGEEEITDEIAKQLFSKTWRWCEKMVRHRCKELKLNYDAMPDYKKFVLKDIVYNTGSISKWYKVLVNTDPRAVIYEARRNPKEMMDSRVCKIAYYYGIAKDLEECKALGLKYSKYLA